MSEGVGASQVLGYVERLAGRGIDVRLHSFEKERPSRQLAERLRRAGVTWTPHPFGRYGTVGGLRRVGAGAKAIRGAELVHARSDLAAASAMLAGTATWLWDVRSLWVDQRLDLGTLVAGSPQERVLRHLEHRAARASSAIVTLTRAVIPELEARHGAGVAGKTTVIPTCVDTRRFTVTAMPPLGSVRFLLAGTVNRYYDVPAMVALVEAARRRRPADLVVLTPRRTAWEDALETVGASRGHARHDEMPAHVAASHVGLVVCRTDVGVSRLGSMPTKIAEFLASGRPVIVNSRLGDASDLVREHSCGVVLEDDTATAVDEALDRLEELLADAGTPSRCRALAEAHFDLDSAVDTLVQTYATMAR